MAYRSSTTANGTSATPISVNVAVPTGVQDNDIILLFASGDQNTGTFTWPAGFTELVQVSVNGDGQKIGCAWKRASGESGNYTVQFAFGGGGSNFVALAAVAFSGRHTSLAPEAISNVDSTDYSTYPFNTYSGCLTLSAGDDTFFCLLADSRAAGEYASATPPTGYTEAFDINPSWCGMEGAYKDNNAAGGTGSINGTATGAGASSIAYGTILVRIPNGLGFEQEGYQWHNDDGSESAASPPVAQDTAVTRPAGMTARLRVLLNANNDPAASQAKLQYRKSGNSEWHDLGG